jgi:hypothetical protein
MFCCSSCFSPSPSSSSLTHAATQLTLEMSTITLDEASPLTPKDAARQRNPLIASPAVRGSSSYMEMGISAPSSGPGPGYSEEDSPSSLDGSSAPHSDEELSLSRFDIIGLEDDSREGYLDAELRRRLDELYDVETVSGRRLAVCALWCVCVWVCACVRACVRGG